MSKTAEECKKEAIARINRIRASARDPELTKAMNRIGAALERLADEHRDISPALERLADAYLHVNLPQEEPSFEGQSLSDREHL